MNSDSNFISLGQPRFAARANGKGPLPEELRSAWNAAFTARGVDAPAQVTGAFAVGARLQDGSVFLAADVFGIHTLCWRVIDGVTHFAERADTLAAMAPAAEIDPQAIFDYLYFHVIPAPRTIFRGVSRVPAGHCAQISGETVRLHPYWRPAFVETRSADFGALADEFKQTLRSAVAAQLDGSKPACFLSGGTDSSTVAGLIGEVAGRPASTFSIGFEAEGYDEMVYARIAAKRFGTDHHEYYVTPADLVQRIPEVARHYDQPFGNSSALPAYCCALVAREHGVTHLLAGDGGDELFGGNARYAKQRIFGWYDHVPQALRSALIEPAVVGSPLGGLPGVRKLRSYVEQARVPLPERMQMYNLLLRLGVSDVFEPGFLAQVDTQDPLRQQKEVWGLARNAGPLNRMLAFDWRYTLGEADLPKVCGSTSLAGLSVGFPFLDAALLEFSLRLPVDYKLKGLKLRWFFKEALRGFLPDEIITKKKQGFGSAIRRLGPPGCGAEASSHRTRWIHWQRVASCGRSSSRNCWNTIFRPIPGYYGEMVWILMMLEQWLQSPNRGRDTQIKTLDPSAMGA